MALCHKSLMPHMSAAGRKYPATCYLLPDTVDQLVTPRLIDVAVYIMDLDATPQATDTFDSCACCTNAAIR